MQTNKEALRLPDPLLVRFFRAGRIDDITKVELDKQRNVTVQLASQANPVRFIHLPDVGWVPDGPCDGI